MNDDNTLMENNDVPSNVVIEDAAVDQVHYWVIELGSNSQYWDECYENGIAILDYDYLGNLKDYASNGAISKAIKNYKNDRNSHNDEGFALWQFTHRIKPGDIIFVKREQQTILGRGIVISDYIYDKYREYHRQLIRVEWTHKGEWRAGERFAKKILTDITIIPLVLNPINDIFHTLDQITPKLFRINWSYETGLEVLRNKAVRDELIKDGKLVIQSRLNCYFPKRDSYHEIPTLQMLGYMKKGDRFILSYGAKVILFGEITSEHWGESVKYENCYEFDFKLLLNCLEDKAESYKDSSIVQEFEKDHKAMWIPYGGSHVFYISQALYYKFDLGVFIPCFGKSLKEFGYSYQNEPLVEEPIGEEKMSHAIYPLNKILYGPPGTGKTYNTVIYAVAICNNRDIEGVKNQAKTKEGYKELLKQYNQLKQEGRIAFTTFHQSYGYEEFIEGLKPIMKEDSDAIGYKVVPGVFKEFCTPATEIADDVSVDAIDDNAQVWYLRLGGGWYPELHNKCLENNEIRIGWPGLTYDSAENTDKTKIGYFVKDMQPNDIVLIPKHKRGSRSTIGWIAKITGDYEDLHDDDKASKTRSVEWLAKNIEWDVKAVNGNKNLNVHSTIYKLGIPAQAVKDFLNDSEEDFEEQSAEKPQVKDTTGNKVFIIDEINRGNISKIFGELITLIEDSKRDGADEAMSVTLPYSGEEFSIPDNVFILGTMNTADRSIAMMDTALRRRFDFEEMLPDPKLLNDIVVKDPDTNQTLNVGDMLEIINKRIEFLYDREHTIGHAFFMSLRDNPSINALGKIFENKVIPLLQEYFYDDYSKIMLVLGDDGKDKSENEKFIKEDKLTDGLFNSPSSSDLLEGVREVRYEINPVALTNINAYLKLSKELQK